MVKWSDWNVEQKENDKKEHQRIERDSITNFYQRYPLEIIPYQIPNGNRNISYFLEAQILGAKSKTIEKAFVKSKDEFTVDGYENGLDITVQYSIKNPYKFEMWIPVPIGLYITSKDYPREDHWIHPNKGYLSRETKFVGREPSRKFDSIHGWLYYLAPGTSLTLQVKFDLIPYTDNVTVCGLSVYVKGTHYEKGILINLKDNSIVGQEIFQEG